MIEQTNITGLFPSNPLKPFLIAAVACLAALGGPAAVAEAPDQAQTDQTEAAEKSYLLVLSAESGELADGKLVLRDTSGKVGWFTDRPFHETGRFPLAQLTGVWSDGADSFEADPPNAVLVANGHETDPTIVELTDLVVEGNTVRFSAKTLEGPETSPEGAVTLVVDNIFDGCWPGNCDCNCEPSWPW